MNPQARSLIKRVREAIADANQRALASDVLQMSIIAIEQFSELDETIYNYFSNEGISLHERDERKAGLTAAMFNEVHAKTFRAVRRLVSYLEAKRLVGDSERPSPTDQEEFDFGEDFDLCFEDTSVSKMRVLADLSIDDLEIDKAFDALADDSSPDSSTMHLAFRDRVATLGRVLVQETETFDRRINVAIERRKFDLALRELDGSRQSLGEGLFALVNSVFEVFGVNIERSDIVPFYKNALEQSLLLRQGLASLSQLVSSENDWVIKDSSMAEGDVREAIARVADMLEEFVRGELCRVMRAPDRLELETFCRKLRSESGTSAELTVEGLANYLESLSVINQREVLVEHDRQVTNELRQSLEAARSLLLVSYDAAGQMVHEALEQSKKLRGRNPKLDETLDSWAADPNLLRSPQDAERVIDILDTFLR